MLAFDYSDTCCIAFAAGWCVFAALSAPATGEPNRLDALCGCRLSLVCGIPWTQYVFHLHHWLYCLVFALLLPVPLLSWACLGGTAQGVLMYRDWYRIIYRNRRRYDVFTEENERLPSARTGYGFLYHVNFFFLNVAGFSL